MTIETTKVKHFFPLHGLFIDCHSREGGNLSTYMKEIPAFAGMTTGKGLSGLEFFTQEALLVSCGNKLLAKRVQNEFGFEHRAGDCAPYLLTSFITDSVTFFHNTTR